MRAKQTRGLFILGLVVVLIGLGIWNETRDDVSSIWEFLWGLIPVVSFSWLPWVAGAIGGVVGALVLWYLVGRRALLWWLAINVAVLLAVSYGWRGWESFADFVRRGYGQRNEFYDVLVAKGFSGGLDHFPDEATWLVGYVALSLIFLIVLSMVLRSVPPGMTPGNFIGRIMELVGHAAAGTVTIVYKVGVVLVVGLVLLFMASMYVPEIVEDVWNAIASGERYTVTDFTGTTWPQVQGAPSRVYNLASEKDVYQVQKVPGGHRHNRSACPELLVNTKNVYEIFSDAPPHLFTRRRVGMPSTQSIWVTNDTGKPFVRKLLKEGYDLDVVFTVAPDAQPGYCPGTREER